MKLKKINDEQKFIIFPGNKWLFSSFIINGECHNDDLPLNGPGLTSHKQGKNHSSYKNNATRKNNIYLHFIL